MLVMVVFFIAFRWIHLSTPLIRLFLLVLVLLFFSSRRRHTRFDCDWSSDVCSSDLVTGGRSPRSLTKCPRRRLPHREGARRRRDEPRVPRNRGVAAPPGRHQVAPARTEIGRASCRVRV